MQLVKGTGALHWKADAKKPSRAARGPEYMTQGVWDASNSVVTSPSAHTGAEGARVPNKSSACRCLRISHHLGNPPSFRMNSSHVTISSIEKKRKRFSVTSLPYTSSHLYVGCFKLPSAEAMYPGILLMPAHHCMNTNKQDLEHFKTDCLI